MTRMARRNGTEMAELPTDRGGLLVVRPLFDLCHPCPPWSPLFCAVSSPLGDLSWKV
jgi:hypothetical protein